MSKNHKGNDMDLDGDVDFDFFDAPVETQNKASYAVTNKRHGQADGMQNKRGHTRAGSKSKHGYRRPNTDSESPVSSDSESDDISDSEVVSVKKIETTVPTGKADNYSDNFDSDSDTDTCTDSESASGDASDKSGRRAPTPGRKSTKNRRRKHSDTSDHSDSDHNRKCKQAWDNKLSVMDNPSCKRGNKSESGNKKCVQSGKYISNASHKRKEHCYIKTVADLSESSGSVSSDLTTDSDSDVTDVSPLNTPHTSSSSGSLKKELSFSDRTLMTKPPRSPISKRPSSGDSNSAQSSKRLEQLLDGNKDSMDLKILMQAVLEMEKEENKTKFIVPFPGSKPRPYSKRNMSFSNDQVLTIDKENQRLMSNILNYAQKAKEARKKKSIKQQPVHLNRTHSSINRLREQRRIDQENKAMLKRLQGTTATKTLKKDHLLSDYNHQLLFGVSPVKPSSARRRTQQSPYGLAISQPRTGSASQLRSESTSDMSVTSQGSSRSGVKYSRPMTGMARSKARPSSAPRRAKSAAAGSATGKDLSTKPAWESGW